MSDINNHGVGMNIINLGADFQELTCEQAAAIQGGAATLFQDVNFGGKSWTFERGTNNVGGDANDQATSAIVEQGWLVCVDANFGGDCFFLPPGAYSDLPSQIGVPNDSITSLGIA